MTLRTTEPVVPTFYSLIPAYSGEDGGATCVILALGLEAFGSHAKTQRRQDLLWKPFRDSVDSVFAPWRLERSGREHHYYSRACQYTACPDRIACREQVELVGATMRNRCNLSLPIPAKPGGLPVSGDAVRSCALARSSAPPHCASGKQYVLFPNRRGSSPS
jgi:hypothetical protein